MKIFNSPFKKDNRPNAFSLVVTLTLMVLLSIIALGLLSLSSVALRSTQADNAGRIARANARMALTVALGELQTYMGPDARVSARAETLSKDSRIGGGVSPNTPKAWWVGVSHSDGTTQLAPAKKAVVWLISGLDGETIASSLSDPVKMISSGSLDLAAFTGGDDIEAGRVTVQDSRGDVAGSYAWFIDDNGMRAQLRPSHPDIRNDNQANPSGGVLAASYDPAILDGMSALGATKEQLQRIGSLGDLEFVGMGKQAIKSKFFGYTTLSQGVLSDTKNGGLKKDLTIAFEKSVVFNQVFPKGNTSAYLLIDKEKLKTSLDLQANGYIHWDMFRDYYNIKKSISTTGGVPSILLSTFNKKNLYRDTTRVNKAPHELNDPDATPYGQPTVGTGPAAYVHSPVSPILSQLQENVWLEYSDGSGTLKPTLSTHAQVWSSHYNPYNITIDVSQGNGTGPRIINFPMIAVTVDGYLNRVDTLAYKLQVHAPGRSLIPPGKSQMFGFAKDEVAQKEEDGAVFSGAVKGLVTESVKTVYTLRAPLPPTVTFKAEFYSPAPALMHGCDDTFAQIEIGQVFFTPFAWDLISKGKGSIDSTTVEKSDPEKPGTWGTGGRTNIPGDRPGKTKSRTLGRNDLGRGSMTSFALKLRTTKESASALRPLIDANIRAQWNNPRWDGPLGLNVVATHSMDFNGEPIDQIPQTENKTPPLGYTFLGSGNTASDPNRVILFDIPRRDLVSLGQLQHAGAGRFSYEPSYVVGNSYANPRIPLTNWKASVSDSFSALPAAPASWAIPGNFNLYDASYIVNEVMFDSYVFTTIPQVDDNFGGGDTPKGSLASVLDGTISLPNPRFRPYVPPGSQFSSDILQNTGSTTVGSFFHNAGHLLVDGSFNVNSTSIDAWEAFISGTFKLPVATINASGEIEGYKETASVRFPRVTASFGSGMKSSSVDENYWTGFRELTQTEVRAIATELVTEIKERGPFLTMGDFVNRRLKNDETGKSGALQAALDRTVNSTTGGMANAATTTGAFSNVPAGATQGTGFPGQLLQSDVLQALSPFMTVRSDTFTIRAYGEARNPSTGEITAKAWCEAVVQRFPDPVKSASNAKSPLQELALPSSPFGRSFSIISFRWLHPAEI